MNLLQSQQSKKLKTSSLLARETFQTYGLKIKKSRRAGETGGKRRQRLRGRETSGAVAFGPSLQYFDFT